MARRKKKCDECPAMASWMLTYGDMVTLLLTFFVLLISMASFEDPGKIESAMQSIRNALRVGGFKRHMVGAVREQAQQQQASGGLRQPVLLLLQLLLPPRAAPPQQPRVLRAGNKMEGDEQATAAPAVRPAALLHLQQARQTRRRPPRLRDGRDRQVRWYEVRRKLLVSKV